MVKKKIVSILVLFTLLLMGIVNVEATNTTYTVGTSGDFTSLQDAVNQASPGDIITILSGTLDVGYGVNINTPGITIQGSGSDSVITTSIGNRGFPQTMEQPVTLLTINSDDVTIRDLVLDSFSSLIGEAISGNGDNLHVENIIIKSGYNGITIASAKNALIEKCTFIGDGLNSIRSFGSDGLQILSSYFDSNTSSYAIQIENAINGRIENSTFNYTGISLTDATDFVIKHVQIFAQTLSGIYMERVGSMLIEGSVIKTVQYCLNMNSCENIIIALNEFDYDEFTNWIEARIRSYDGNNIIFRLNLIYNRFWGLEIIQNSNLDFYYNTLIGGIGLVISKTTGADVEYNSFFACDIAIEIDTTSHDISILHNNFYDDTSLLDESTNTIWYDEEGGNYYEGTPHPADLASRSTPYDHPTYNSTTPLTIQSPIVIIITSAIVIVLIIITLLYYLKHTNPRRR